MGGSDYLIFKRSLELNFNIPLSETADSILPSDARDLMLTLLKIDPKERPTIE
jgi:hypothetical protein